MKKQNNIIYIRQLAQQLGFCDIAITDSNVELAGKNLQAWVKNNFNGDLVYLANNLSQRIDPKSLMPEVKTIICCAMNYNSAFHSEYIARFALGRDYHKVVKKRLLQLAKKINAEFGDFNYRCCVDSAPLLEKPLAVKAGLGWQGKNSLLINKKFGSWVLLGTILTNLDLSLDLPSENHCGDCNQCINNCPTKAIVAPYILDARRCIAYLTIEYKGVIPIELRDLIGKRIFGCDACQIVCPWNKNAIETSEKDFMPHEKLITNDLLQFFSWGKEEFLHNTLGSSLRRIGYECWLRNIAIALGNGEPNKKIILALQKRLTYASPLLREHIEWALAKLMK